ncbi:hypothetical protein [Chamaesiphon minutus]|uniref:Uncharacterized protein n=1 Tax=Chamaesiphon minutus (strain ATCC 27169 / PCC 6605) TaxID=1173020 RepID=K9UJ81_CHAP6|nr:hypothetical protein [Chamaesiphon minutus]AFY94506.1 hypothetical protein Cha6605_3516 [Chamaesiphon minutus PCC 6605]
MQDRINQNIEKKSNLTPSIELINGYYLSFLAIGLSLVLLRNDLSSDLKQGLFFVLMALIFGSIDLFKSAANKEINAGEDKRYSKIVVHGDYYNRIGDEVYNTSNENIADIKMDTPSNYFDVLKVIEVVPDSPNPNQPGIKDVLVQLHSYVESDSTLLVSEKEKIFELIKQMAIEAQADPINNYAISVIESIQKIDRNTDFKARIVRALKAGSMLAFDEYLSKNSSIKIVEAAIKGWMEETKQT